MGKGWSERAAGIKSDVELSREASKGSLEIVRSEEECIDDTDKILGFNFTHELRQQMKGKLV